MQLHVQVVHIAKLMHVKLTFRIVYIVLTYTYCLFLSVYHKLY